MEEMSSEEAKEEVEQIEESDERPISEESAGDDLMENQSEDYRQIDELDRYQDEGVDH